MASTATGCLAEKSSADVIIQIAKPVLRQKKLFLLTKRVFDIVCSETIHGKVCKGHRLEQVCRLAQERITHGQLRNCFS